MTYHVWKYTLSGFEQFENGQMYDDEKIEGLNNRISTEGNLNLTAVLKHQMAYNTVNTQVDCKLYFKITCGADP